MISLSRRRFLTATGTAAGVVLAGPHFLRQVSAQGSGPIKIGFPLPLTGPFAAIAADLKRGAELALDELNARGGVMGRKVEVLFRDDELKPAIGAQRTKELIENQKVEFVVGGLAAHVQMAINEQTKKAGKLFISISQSDEISAKPDTSPITFHEALNPTITCRVVGKWALQNLGKKWWIVYADYAWGKQNNAVFTDVIAKATAGPCSARTPYPLGKRGVLGAPAQDPGRQARRAHVGHARRRQRRLPQAGAQLRHEEGDEARSAAALPRVPKEGGAELYAGRLRRHQLLLGAGQDTIPNAKKFVDASMKKFNMPPDDYAGYCYIGHHGSRAGRRAGQVHQRGGGGQRAAEEPHLRSLQGQAVVAGLRQQVLPGHVDHEGALPRPDQGRVGLTSTSSAKVAADEKSRPHLRREGTRVGACPARADLSLTAVAAQVFTGLVLGGIFVLLAIGLSLIFGLMTVVNFSHGVALHARRLLHGLRARLHQELLGWPWCSRRSWSGSLGLLVERFLIRRLYGRSPDDPLLLTFGLSLVLVETAKLIWGKIGLTLDPPA